MSEAKQKEVKQQEELPGVRVTVRPERPMMPRVVLICGEEDETHGCPADCQHDNDQCNATMSTESFYYDNPVDEKAGRFFREVNEHMIEHDKDSDQTADVIFACMCRVTIARVTGVVMRVEPRMIHYRLALQGDELGELEVLSEEDSIATDIEGQPWFQGDSYATVIDSQGRRWMVLCSGPREERPLVSILSDTSMEVAHQRNHYVNAEGYRHMTCRRCFDDRTALLNLIALQRIREVRERLKFAQLQALPRNNEYEQKCREIQDEYAYRRGDVELRKFAKQLLAVRQHRDEVLRRYNAIMKSLREDEERRKKDQQ